MAGTLTITDGTVSVNLYDASTLYLRRGGWRPAVAKENAAGDDYDDVIEVIGCEWMQTTDDARDATMHNLNYLAAKARQNERQRKLTDQVYFSLNTPSETNVRYGVIKDINVPDLDSWHFGPSQPVKLTITARREGAWRSVSPLTAPQSYPSLGNQTVYNRSVSGARNYLDIAAASVTGDALALPVLQVSSLSAQQTSFVVALRSRISASDITSFEPHFNAVSFTDATYIVADAAAPGGQKWERTAAGAGTITNHVALPAGLSVYRGSFLVYGVCRASATGVTLAVGHSISAAFATNTNPAVTVPVTTNYMPLYLGRITLPPAGLIPGINNPANYYLNLSCTFTAAATFAMRNLYIVPVDDGVFELGNAQAAFFIDSVLERSYAVSAPTNRYIDKVVIPRGRYLRLRPNYNHRIMFFFNQADAAGGLDPAHAADVDVRATMRYLALRGNT